MPEEKTPQQDQSQAQSPSAKGQRPGEPAPGLKDKDAETSNSYGNTRDSGETPKK